MRILEKNLFFVKNNWLHQTVMQKKIKSYTYR